MWRIFSLFVVCLVFLFSVQAQTVIETESSLVLQEKTADVSLVIENKKSDFNDSISLELLDEKDIVRAKMSSPRRIKSGKDVYKLSLPLGDLMQTAENEIAWYRLRYRVGEARGIISLSTIIRDIFEIRVIASEDLFSGMTYRNRVRATNPFNNQPVAGVKINSELELELKGDDEKKLKLTATGETDGEGFAVLEFQIPPEAEFDYHSEITITGKKNGIVREAEEELRNVTNDSQFLMMTDKPIYQPEQTLSVRGILLKGTEKKVVVKGTELEFLIEDEDNTVLYREKVKTSLFGVASIAWKIPENAKLGDYRIRVKIVEVEENEYVGYQRVKISRYDLPNFTINAKALKSYYLPNEPQAEVEVSADYLFGKPVTNGKVRVVRENGREWNWAEQKYDIQEGESHEGKTDENGKFSAKFDLTKDHEKLKDNDYRKFYDLNFTAYYTDLTTNRTEQRRFDVRVTKEAIHVYFIGEDYRNHPNLTVNAYVSAFYADGLPCTCEVELKGREEDSDEKYRTLQKLKTNSFGAGKLNFMRPKFEDGDGDLEIEIIAKDKNGLKGSLGGEDYDGYDDDIEFSDDDDAIQVQTEKTIFKAGEAVKIKLTSTKQTGLVYVDVVKDWSVVESRFVNLQKGKAELKIPYQPNFQGVLKISAFMEDSEEEDDDLVTGGRGIIFPTQTNLKVEANFDKETYKPAEEARVSFGVLDSVGQVIESALGVVIFDKAVEERARTDSDFNGMFYGFRGWLGYGDSFGGVNVKDLNDLDLTKPISDEMQLVAEVMLYDETYFPNIFHSREYEKDAQSVYADSFKKQFDSIEKKLAEHYKNRNFEHPTDEASFNRILQANSINFEDLRDPWEQRYKAVFAVEKTNDVLRIVSSGADKTFDTKDDLTVSSSSFQYFAPTANAMDKALKDFYARTSSYIRDQETLFKELGITELKDRFGRPYQFRFYISGRFYYWRIRSFGADGVDCDCSWKDDFQIYENKQDYFAETELKILDALKTAKKTPLNEMELKELLKSNNVNFDEIRDGYGEKVYLVKREFSRYTDVVKEEIVSEFGKEKTTKRTVITPVTQGIISFTIRSKGADSKEGTYDDATLAEFNQIISEQSKDDKQPVIKPISFTNTGSISGVVTDPNGAVIAGANVTATNTETSVARTVTTDENGKYLIANLAAGKYSVKVEARGFKSWVTESIPVTANSVIKLDVNLDAGSVNEAVTVDVSAAEIRVETSSSRIEALPKSVVPALQLAQLKPGVTETEKEESQASQKSTPKLREYFPETLYWSPELLTDKNGKATINFKMADSITTWKLYTIASTKNGKIGVAEKEVQAFQPFFVDLDPPKFLTDGDEIYLPTQIRNYTPSKQKVEVTMAKADWFSFLSPELQKIEVDKNAANNAVFGFKANTPIKDGKQRVTAIAQTDSDAIEKPVTVRPNGEEIVRTETKLFANSAQFEVNFPVNALPKTPKSELKIYPNLLAHVTESVEGLLQRPYGCGEQTISSTYPNLMILKFIKTENSLTKKAKKNLQKGYERLLGYQVADGGFSYWGGKSESDLALTAYALRFLANAEDFIEMDEKVVEKAEKYLLAQQRADGSFYQKYYWEEKEDTKRSKMLTTYIARTLAMLKADKASLDKALNYLKNRNAEIDEPYTLALYALASFDAGNIDEAEKTVTRLQNLAKDEGGTAYWNLETNTPFYGWGTAGRIETSALVIQAMLKSKDQNQKTKDLISKGTMFLLKNKDRYGVWYSTQTTINVLDAFLASLTESKNQTISVSMNGEKVQDFAVSADQIEPIIVPLSDKLASANRLEIKSSDDSQMMAQVVKNHYIDWKDSVSTNRNVNGSRAIRLDYKCDKLQPKIMENVTCSVEAERSGFRGYGMLLAEIGIPPGADVSRESLEKAFDADWSLSRYDILPDRIIVYMWAKAGGSKFNFTFKPRYGINAQTPMSVVYDYYNEESNGTVAPLRFEVIPSCVN